MRILLIREYNPFIENGASANRFRGLIEGLRRLGHRVDIAITGGCLRPKETETTDENTIYLTKANRYAYWPARLNYYLLDGYRLWETKRNLIKLDMGSYDVIWLTNNQRVLKLFLSNKGSWNVPTFIELNEFNDIHKGKGATGNFLQRMKGRSSEDTFLQAVRFIDLFAVMTKTLLNHYRSLTKEQAKFMHLPMTVDLSRFEYCTETRHYQKPFIAFTGTMNNEKDGVDVLIKAFHQIAYKYPSIHLYLAGFYHYDVPMQDDLIRQYQLEDRVHRLGVLDREQIPEFLCNASLLVLSRPDSHQAQGGFPTKLGEYLATGNPVCVTKVGEIPDYLEDNVSAFMAEPGDVDSFADAMDRAFRDPENARKVGLRGRKVAETEFNAEIQAKRLYEFLQENLK